MFRTGLRAGQHDHQLERVTRFETDHRQLHPVTVDGELRQPGQHPPQFGGLELGGIDGDHLPAREMEAEGGHVVLPRRAIPLFEQNIAIFSQTMDDDHPLILSSRGVLASAYHATGDLDRAISLFEQTVAQSKQVLGDEHPDVLVLCFFLAHAYRDAGNLGRAISLYETTLADCERVLGTQHPATQSLRARSVC